MRHLHSFYRHPFQHAKRDLRTALLFCSDCRLQKAQIEAMMLSLTVSRRIVVRHGRRIPNAWRQVASTEAAALSSSPSLDGQGIVRPAGRSAPSAVTLAAAIAAASVVGFAAGRYSSPDQQNGLVLPNGLPRTCCENDELPPLTEAQSQMAVKLARIVGEENVLDGRQLDTATTPFLKGARLGGGPALCIVTPRYMHHVVAVVQTALGAGCVVLPQGQNTGLTGGSVPHHRDRDHRPVVIVSLKHLDAIFPLDDGKRVVCFAGSGLASVRAGIAAISSKFDLTSVKMKTLTFFFFFSTRTSWNSFSRNISPTASRTPYWVPPF